MTKYPVEARLTYEVEAAAIDDALRAVSASIQDNKALSIEYLVRQLRIKPAPPIILASDDFQGLDKPVYTVAELASILGTSRGSVHEMVRRGTRCIRMGRRVLIPRSAILAMLNGEVRIKNIETMPSARPPRISVQRVRVAAPESVPSAALVRRQPAQSQQRNSKSLVSVIEAARVLRISASRMRELMAQRRIYFVEHGPRPRIPLKAIANFANGRSAKAMLEENIAHAKASGPWDDEMEQIAAKLPAEWTAKEDAPG